MGVTSGWWPSTKTSLMHSLPLMGVTSGWWCTPGLPLRRRWCLLLLVASFFPLVFFPDVGTDRPLRASLRASPRFAAPPLLLPLLLRAAVGRPMTGRDGRTASMLLRLEAALVESNV